MKSTGFINTTSLSARRATRGRRPLALAATALFMGLALCAQARPALCATHVYVYMDGSYQDVTSEIQVIDGHTYVMVDNPFEIVIVATIGHVYDSDNVLIGYTQDDGPMPPAS